MELINYKNNEELFFSYYLDELKEKGFIERYEYEPETFELSPEVTFNYVKTTQLKTKVKTENKTKALLHKHSYTPDFKIIPSNAGFECRMFDYLLDSFPIFICSENAKNGMFDIAFPCYIDIKGAFGGKLSTSITFPLNQKWMYQKYDIYVQKIKPFDLFKQTFMPKLVIEEMKYKRDYWKKGKLLGKKGDSRLDYKPLTIKEWLDKYDKK